MCAHVCAVSAWSAAVAITENPVAKQGRRKSITNQVQTDEWINEDTCLTQLVVTGEKEACPVTYLEADRSLCKTGWKIVKSQRIKESAMRLNLLGVLEATLMKYHNMTT